MRIAGCASDGKVFFGLGDIRLSLGSGIIVFGGAFYVRLVTDDVDGDGTG